MRKRIAWIIISLLWIGFIFFNSTRTASESSEASNTLVMFIKDVLLIFNIKIGDQILSLLIRKGAHFFEFFVLGVFLSFAFFIRISKDDKISYSYFAYLNSLIFIYLVVLVLSFTVAIIDEHIQGFIDGRAKSVVDVFIDFAGSFCASIILDFLNKKKIKSMLNIN